MEIECLLGLFMVATLFTSTLQAFCGYFVCTQIPEEKKKRKNGFAGSDDTASMINLLRWLPAPGNQKRN